MKGLDTHHGGLAEVIVEIVQDWPLTQNVGQIYTNDGNYGNPSA